MDYYQRAQDQILRQQQKRSYDEAFNHQETMLVQIGKLRRQVYGMQEYVWELGNIVLKLIDTLNKIHHKDREEDVASDDEEMNSAASESEENVSDDDDAVSEDGVS